MKMKHGSDFDAIPLVGAELAEAGSVLCFDEFQCTDVADAMILRRWGDVVLFLCILQGTGDPNIRFFLGSWNR